MPRIDQIDRQTDTLLLVFSLSPTIHGVTRIQTLLFLLNNETKYAELYDDSVLFEFSPAKMGPFASAIYDELDFLRALGAIEVTPSPVRRDSDRPSSSRDVILTDKGEKIASQRRALLSEEVATDLEQFGQRYCPMDLSLLLAYVSAEYPTMAARSDSNHRW